MIYYRIERALFLSIGFLSTIGMIYYRIERAKRWESEKIVRLG